LPHPWKSMRTCAIIHPLHVELETASAINVIPKEIHETSRDTPR